MSLATTSTAHWAVDSQGFTPPFAANTLLEALHTPCWFSFHSVAARLSHVSVILQVACPCFPLQWTSFLHLSLVRCSPFIHADFLLCLLDLPYIRMDHLAALRKLFWKINRLPGPLPLQSRSLLDHAKKIPKGAALLKTRAVTLLFVLLTSLSLTSESHSCCWQGCHHPAHLQPCSSLLVTAGPIGLP